MSSAAQKSVTEPSQGDARRFTAGRRPCFRPHLYLCVLVFHLAVTPTRLDAQTDLLRDCERHEAPAQAIRACSAILRQIPNAAAIYNRRGVAYMQQGDLVRAIADYSEAIRLDGTDPWPHYNRGRALLDQSDWPRAVEDFTQSIIRRGHNALAYNGRARAHFKLAKLAEALDDVNRAIAFDPNYAAALDTRGHIYEAMGRRPEAIADLRQALRLEPTNPLAHVTREALMRLGAEP